jgi:uncharacterized RmlC-like cupin family protein
MDYAVGIEAPPILEGEGWAISPTLDSLGTSGFRRVRQQLGLTAFGMNVKVMQPGAHSKLHLHTEQQEVIFVHEGEIHVTFGNDDTHEVGVGAIVVVEPGTPHVVRVTSKQPAVLVMMGGKDGVVEGDAVFPEE